MNLDLIQEKLEKLSKKWWFYLSLLILTFFVPVISEKPYSYEEITNVMVAALSQGLAPYLLLGIIIRISFLVMIVLAIIFKDKISRILSLFIAFHYILIGLVQNIVYTIEYGLVIILGNMILDFLIAFSFIWEAIIHKNNLTPVKQQVWKYWVIPFAFLAFWWPMNDAGQMELNPALLIFNVGILAYCAITPIYLAIYSLYYPNINPAIIRISSFIGIYFGVMNMITWLPNPATWWLAILHLPLLTISLFMFIFQSKWSSLQ